MKKRLLSLALALCLTVTLFAGLTTTASAADDRRSGFLVPYTFQAGDTIYGVCEKMKIDFGANLNLIGKINGIINFNYMMPGNELLLPTDTIVTGKPYYTLLEHTLTPGETPASLCQSYGIDYNKTYNLLAALNTNLTTFMAGQVFTLPLYVAPAGTGSSGSTGSSTGTGSTGSSGADTPAATPIPVPESSGTSGNIGSTGTTAAATYYLAQHVLLAGETVSGVCAALGVNFMNESDAIQRINDIASYNYLLPGKTLLIPTSSVPSTGSYYKVISHTVAAGDTAYGICGAYGLSFDAYSALICKLNNRTDMNILYQGQTIYIPVYVAAPTTGTTPTTPAPGNSGTGTGTGSGTTATATPAPAATPIPLATATPTPAPDNSGVTGSDLPTGSGDPANIPAEDTLEYLIIPHVLEAGETVSGICAELGVDFASNADRIKQLSNIADFNYLLPGKVIMVPTTTYPSSGPYYKIMKHTLVAGDAVSNLCSQYGLNYNNNIAFLQRLNNRTDMGSFYVGDTLYLPLYVAG